MNEEFNSIEEAQKYFDSIPDKAKSLNVKKYGEVHPIAFYKENITRKEQIEFDSQNEQASMNRSFLSDNKTKNKFHILSFKELGNYENDDDSEWIVEGLIKPKNTSILGGPAGALKSWFSLYLGFSIALGKPFVNNFVSKQGAVLIIDRENFIPELKKRTALIAKGLGVSEEQEIPIYFLSEQHIKLDSQLDLQQLENFVREKNVILIIADTYRRLISFEENAADSVSNFFNDMIKPFCEKTGASFLFIHHHKKHNPSVRGDLELLRGSSDFGNFVDCVLQVSRSGDIMTVKQSKMRGARELKPFNLKVDSDEENYFKFLYEGEYQPIEKINKAIETILLWISQNKIKEFKTKEAQKIVDEQGIKKTNFYSALTELCNMGEIIKEGHGSYKIPIQKNLKC